MSSLTKIFGKATILFILMGGISDASDVPIQLARIMGGRSGAAVVIDVQSGHILAIYRPEVAARRLVRPASAFKPFTLLALLQSGKLSRTDSLVCQRNLRVGTHDLSCSHPQIGPLQAVAALAYSCNDFFATFGQRLSGPELQAAFQKAGFASPTGLAEGEAVGSIHTARTKEERQLQAVGEGDMRATPLEMVAAYRNIALKRMSSESTAADRMVFQGLEEATAYGMSRLASPTGIKIAGKTGTPKAEDGNWSNGWFAGYAPADKPEIALVVFVERGTGPSDAAPLAAEIFNSWWKAKQK